MTQQTQQQILEAILDSFCKKHNIPRQKVSDFEVPELEVITDKR